VVGGGAVARSATWASDGAETVWGSLWKYLGACGSMKTHPPGGKYSILFGFVFDGKASALLLDDADSAGAARDFLDEGAVAAAAEVGFEAAGIIPLFLH
jgi:hypothetical protein